MDANLQIPTSSWASLPLGGTISVWHLLGRLADKTGEGCFRRPASGLVGELPLGLYGAVKSFPPLPLERMEPGNRQRMRFPIFLLHGSIPDTSRAHGILPMHSLPRTRHQTLLGPPVIIPSSSLPFSSPLMHPRKCQSRRHGGEEDPVEVGSWGSAKPPPPPAPCSCLLAAPAPALNAANLELLFSLTRRTFLTIFCSTENQISCPSRQKATCLLWFRTSEQ